MGTDHGSHTFAPGPAAGRAFRDALGRFTTGITVVTTGSSEGPIGITANSFSSVSMDPPLVLWSPAKASRRFPHFERAEYYAIHVLRHEQAEVSHAFTRSATAFSDLDWHQSERGVPLIDNCLARFECSKYAAHDAGDHMIMVGQVERVTISDGAPLLFFQGIYGGFHNPG